jgi:hypothetical protein
VHAVYRSGELRRLLSRHAWQTVAERFNVASMGNAYLAAIHDAQRGKRTRGGSTRSGVLDESLLGDMPHLPKFLVRPLRKLLRVLGFWPGPSVGPDPRRTDPVPRVGSGIS